METLLGYMIREPGEFTRAYLSRVAECYVRAMKPEFAVMVRAVLDAAIQETITDEEVTVEVGASGGVNLERRIQACYARGLFDQNLFSAADLIREVGNKAVHLTPGLETDADELLEKLVKLLRVLEQYRK